MADYCNNELIVKVNKEWYKRQFLSREDNISRGYNVPTADKVLEIFKNYVATETEGEDGPYVIVFDFKKIMPEPIGISEKIIDWYDWRARRWSVRCDYPEDDSLIDFTEGEDGKIYYKFTTPWNPPYCIFEEVVKIFPMLILKVRMTDDDGLVEDYLTYSLDKIGMIEVRKGNKSDFDKECV